MKCIDCGREGDCSCWAQALDESYARCPECDREYWRKKIDRKFFDALREARIAELLYDLEIPRLGTKGDRR